MKSVYNLNLHFGDFFILKLSFFRIYILGDLMLKKSAIRRILTATIALIIVSILYFFPNTKTDTYSTPSETHYISTVATPIFLKNKDNYLVRTTVAINSTEDLDKAKELIEALTIDSEKKDYIPNNFSQIIPKNTKLLEISLEEDIGLLKLNFSKEFLNVTKDQEEPLIEALVFTLTEISSIKSIMIFIEGEKLDYLPQSKVTLPNTLDRTYGINKVYDITNIKGTSKTIIYYIGKEDDITYYIPVTKINNNENNKIEIIIEELKSSPIYETNLISYLASSTELLNYEILENQINLSFNNEIFNDFNEKNILEEVKYSISLSMKDTLGVEQVNFIVDNEVVETFKES